MSVIFNIGIFLSIFLGVLLLTKRNKSLPDKILAVWMFIIGIHLMSYFLYSQGYWDNYPNLIGITVPFPLLHGPMLYLYIYFIRSAASVFSRPAFPFHKTSASLNGRPTHSSVYP
jgi:hypothetical protein